MATPQPSDLNVDLHADARLIERAAEVALEGYRGAGEHPARSLTPFERLNQAGSEFWLDTGDHQAIEPLACRELSAVTTNNTLVNQVVQKGSLDSIVPEAARRLREIRTLDDRDLVFELGFVANAHVALSLVERFGVKVSVELHPAMSTDLEASLLFARRYYALCPDWFIVKIPLQPAGFLAVRQLHEEGIPVNYTLGFSARQNYLAAMFSRPRYVNVFLGRLNSLVEEQGFGDGCNIGERTALASQEWIRHLRESDPGIPTRQIAASIRNGKQVADLAGVDVLTIPPKAAEEYRATASAGPLPRHRADELDVKLNDSPWRESIEMLWQVDDGFERFAQQVSSTPVDSPVSLTAAAREHQVDLFREWTPDDIEAVRAGGKIPKLDRWVGAPLDDLMTQSALQSFATDQKALDDHLLGLVK